MPKKTIPILIVFLLLAACQPALTEVPPEAFGDLSIAEESAVEAMEQPAPDTNAQATGVPPAGTGVDISPLSYVPAGSRLVIKDAEMELLVENIDLTIANVTQLAFDSGGYIISSQTWFEETFKFASLRLAVPVTAFETTLNTLRLFGVEVLRESASGQDVTAEYVDLESRLQNLEATAARVRGFLEAANTVEEALAVNEQLAELEAEIEVIKGQLRYYESRAAFSTVTVLLTPARPTPTPTATPTATPAPFWNPGETFDEASTTLVSITQVLVDLLIWIVVVPGPFLAVAGLALWGVRRRNSKRGN